jgi:hypothetical protein
MMPRWPRLKCQQMVLTLPVQQKVDFLKITQISLASPLVIA